MPPLSNTSHDHVQPSSASQNAVADPPRSSVGSTTSYTTLAHALAPDSSRASKQGYYRQSTSRSSPQMTSDSRYMYHPQEVAPAPPYPYPPYPGPPYENGQYAQTSSRPPVRSPPPVQHPPQHPPYNGAPPSYPPQPGYPPGYGVPPPHPHPQQWSGEWSHYPAPYPSAPPPGQQPAYPPPGAPRPDLSPSASNDDRRYPQQPQRPEPRRTEDRPPQRPEAAPPPSTAPVRKTRENDHPPPGPAPPPPVPVQAQAPISAPAQSGAPSLSSPGIGIDFAKLVESYRLILDSASALQYDPTVVRPPAPPETLERMLQAAAYGAQVLDAAVKRVAPEPPRAPAERPPEESDGEVPQNRQSENGPATEGQTCLGCSATSTPEWRRGPMGPRTLCNACGLVYAKLIKKRNRDGPGRQRGGQNAKQSGQAVARATPAEDPGASSGEGSGDDEDSYGSQQDRQSELGYRGSRE